MGCIELCRSSEDLSDEEKQAELVPIAVQELFIVLQQGRIDEITNILQEINVSE